MNLVYKWSRPGYCAAEGVWWEAGEAEALACQLHKTPSVTFAGVYVHCGNSYKAVQSGDVESVRDQTIGESLAHILNPVGAHAPTFVKGFYETVIVFPWVDLSPWW